MSVWSHDLEELAEQPPLHHRSPLRLDPQNLVSVKSDDDTNAKRV